MQALQGPVTDPSSEQVLHNSLWVTRKRNPAPIAVLPLAAWDRQAPVLSGSVCLLFSEGSLEPQIEDLIHRINELQQGKFGTLDWPVDTSSKAALTQCLLPLFGPAEKRSSEELGEAQALQEAMHQELDSCEWGQKRDPGILNKRFGKHLLGVFQM